MTKQVEYCGVLLVQFDEHWLMHVNLGLLSVAPAWSSWYESLPVSGTGSGVKIVRSLEKVKPYRTGEYMTLEGGFEGCIKVKVNVHTLDIAPLGSESPPQKRSGMVRVLKGFHSFTCTPTRSSAIGMSHTCLCLFSRSWYTHLPTPKGWKAE